MKSFVKVVALRKAGLKRKFSCLFAAGILGHCLGSLADRMLGQFPGEVQPHSSLNFTAGNRVLFVVVSKAGGLDGDSLKDVVNEGVHDAHSLTGDAGVGVNLLQDLVDIDGVALLARLSSLFSISTGRLGLGRRLLFSFF